MRSGVLHTDNTYDKTTPYNHNTKHLIYLSFYIRSFAIDGTFYSGGTYDTIGLIKANFNCKLSDLKA